MYQNMNSYGAMMIDCYFFNKDTGFIVGGKITGPTQVLGNVILYTSDGGSNWVTRYTDNSRSICWKICFVNQNTGYVSNDQYTDTLTFNKTTDGGSTWIKMRFPTNAGAAHQQGIGFINENTGWIGGGEQTFKTTNGGLNWLQDNFGINLNRFIFLSDSLGYAVGKKVYKFTNKIIGIHLISYEFPEKFLLEQNYPNPFNPVTKIKFDTPSDVRGQTSDVKLNVFDVLGKEVMTLVNEALAPGSYEVDFEGSSIASGMYYYK